MLVFPYCLSEIIIMQSSLKYKKYENGAIVINMIKIWLLYYFISYRRYMFSTCGYSTNVPFCRAMDKTRGNQQTLFIDYVPRVTQTSSQPEIFKILCRQTANIRRAFVGNKIVVHSDVVGASPDGAAPTASSFSTQHLASIYCTKTTNCKTRRQTFKILDFVWLILEIWRYIHTNMHTSFVVISFSIWECMHSALPLFNPPNSGGRYPDHSFSVLCVTWSRRSSAPFSFVSGDEWSPSWT